ncbi:MAG TPA: hypothetical protein VMU32_02475 [Solirubrobacteraceae bacterium]|nr:hypothetical protein [Solirubrobacteraceae bacterium]
MPEIGEHEDVWREPAGHDVAGEVVAADAPSRERERRVSRKPGVCARVRGRARARAHTSPKRHTQPPPDEPPARPPAEPPAEPPGAARGTGLPTAPWAVALAVAIPLAAAYLMARPPSGDLAAATYRGELFGRVGITLWDNGWYGGHYLPGYSILSPALGWLLGERLLLVLGVVAASGLFGLLVEGVFGRAGARVAAAVFALGFAVELLSGRVAYDLGVAMGLLALLALRHGWRAAALALAPLTSLASPVAGAFLAIAGLAYALGETEPAYRPAKGGVLRRAAGWLGHVPADTEDLRLAAGRGGDGLGLAFLALAPIALFAVVFPEGGFEPFAPSVFWPGVAGVVVIALLLPGRLGDSLTPRTRRMLGWGAWLYAAALVGSFVLQTPVGSNASRLGELLAAPLVAGALWERHRLALALAAPLLLYWQLETSISDVSELVGDPSVQASYYAPLAHELRELAGGRPLRVEVPQTGAHWESVYLPERGPILLARGWERQLDTRYARPLYASRLTSTAYRAWLAENAVAYVALPDVRLDFSATTEGRLIRAGLPYLREVWRGRHWRLFAVRGATPLAQAPARMVGVGADSFTLRAPRAGAYEVRIRFTPYWALGDGRGCVGAAPGGWTELRADAAGTFRVGIDFAPGRIFATGPRCRS